MTKHTPGPWYQHHSEHSVRVCNGAHDTPEGCKAIAEAEILGYKREASEANARLIAAAPEMLESLEQAATFLGEALIDNDIAEDAKLIHDQIMAAIRKAKGE